MLDVVKLVVEVAASTIALSNCEPLHDVKMRRHVSRIIRVMVDSFAFGSVLKTSAQVE